MTKLNDGLPSSLGRNVLYKLRHPDRVKESNKKYSENNKEKIKEYNKRWRESTKEERKLKGKTYYEANKDRLLAYHKKYSKDNRKVLRENAKGRILFNKFGITKEEYNEMYIKQGGVCAICKNPELSTNRSLAVDHDHKTGKVRALLCGKCNKALGLFSDDVDLLNSASSYLRFYGEHND